MSIQQTKKQSDLEKRLRLIRQQVYGKEKLNVRSEKLDIKVRDSKLDQTSSIQHPTSDIVYLHQDLLKIFIFATSAIGIQLILFILSRNHILNLNLF